MEWDIHRIIRNGIVIQLKVRQIVIHMWIQMQILRLDFSPNKAISRTLQQMPTINQTKLKVKKV
jgi:hypothetical protein